MIRIIHHVFAPLADTRQCRTVYSLLLQPWRWKNGSAQETFARELSAHMKGQAVLFASGREALLALLLSLEPQEHDEVIVPGYTCVVVLNAVKAAGMVPVLCDVEPETLNIDPAHAKALLSSRTRAVLCQHTFGIPAQTRALLALCECKNIALIEDCAHMLPDADGPADVGIAPMVFCSFGRDKALSGIAGGAAIVRDEELLRKVQKLESQARHLPFYTIKRLLLYPLLYRVSLPLYSSGVGKVLLAAAGKLKLLVPIVTAEEKNGHMQQRVRKMPHACAVLALQQLRRLHAINNHRRSLTAYYVKEATKRSWPLLAGVKESLPLQKVPLFVRDAETMRQTLKRSGIYLEDGWTNCTICPSTCTCQPTDANEHDTPQACAAGASIFSLPTHPSTTLRDCERLVHAIDAAGGLHGME